MEHSTFDRNEYKLDSYDLLEFNLVGAGRTVPVYILATTVEGSSFESIREKMRDTPAIKGICLVNGTVNMIVQGEYQAKQVAQKFYRKTMIRVGIVCYSGQNMGKLYSELIRAIDLARKEGETFHVYNPEKDSLQAIIDQALSESIGMP